MDRPSVNFILVIAISFNGRIPLRLLVSRLGRELSGLPSKHSAKGRDRSVYFIWQGRNASSNERGAAALLTVELDSNRGPQVKIINYAIKSTIITIY